MAYELLVARRGHHVPFVTFGHWQWGDIDRGTDVFKGMPPRHASRGAPVPPREVLLGRRRLLAGVAAIVVFVLLAASCCCRVGVE